MMKDMMVMPVCGDTVYWRHTIFGTVEQCDSSGVLVSVPSSVPLSSEVCFIRVKYELISKVVRAKKEKP